jgi:DNA polymerase-3 subunit gamma/tau
MDEAPFEGEPPAQPSTGQASGDQAQAMARTAGVVQMTAVTAVQRTALGDRWADTVAGLVAANAITALVKELAMQAELLAIEPGTTAECWRLQVERETLRAPALADKLQAALVAHGLSLRLEIVPGVPGDSPARREAEAAARRQREAEAIIHDDPLVQAMLAQFSTARIVPGSIRPA